MGTTPSREVLLSSGESRKGFRNFKWNLRSFFKNNRLVRDELRKEVQCSIHDEQTELCHCVSLLQESPESVQQEDVRSLLPVQKDQVQGSGHNRWAAKLFRVGSLRRNNKVSGIPS